MPPPNETDKLYAKYSDRRLDEEAQRQNVPVEFVRRMARTESGGDPNVISGRRRSSAGAIGKMQLMPGTAKDLGVNPYNATENVEGGVRYAKQQLDTFGGDQRKAAAAYNWGPERVKKLGVERAPAETQNYMRQVAGEQRTETDDLYERFQQQQGSSPRSRPAPSIGAQSSVSSKTPDTADNKPHKAIPQQKQPKRIAPPQPFDAGSGVFGKPTLQGRLAEDLRNPEAGQVMPQQREAERVANLPAGQRLKYELGTAGRRGLLQVNELGENINDLLTHPVSAIGEGVEGLGRGALQGLRGNPSFAGLIPDQDQALTDLQRRRQQRMRANIEAEYPGDAARLEKVQSQVAEREAASPSLPAKVGRGVVSGAIGSAPMILAGNVPGAVSMAALGSDPTKPGEFATNVAGAVLPVKAGKLAAPLVENAARALPKAAPLIRGAAPVAIGAGANVAQTAATGETDPEKLAEAAAVGGLMSGVDAFKAGRMRPSAELPAQRSTQQPTRADEVSTPMTYPQMNRPSKPELMRRQMRGQTTQVQQVPTLEGLRGAYEAQLAEMPPAQRNAAMAEYDRLLNSGQRLPVPERRQPTNLPSDTYGPAKPSPFDWRKMRQGGLPFEAEPALQGAQPTMLPATPELPEPAPAKPTPQPRGSGLGGPLIFPPKAEQAPQRQPQILRPRSTEAPAPLPEPTGPIMEEPRGEPVMEERSRPPMQPRTSEPVIEPRTRPPVESGREQLPPRAQRPPRQEPVIEERSRPPQILADREKRAPFQAAEPPRALATETEPAAQSFLGGVLRDQVENLKNMKPEELDAFIREREKARNEDIRGIREMGSEEARDNGEALKLANKERNERVRRKEMPAKFTQKPSPKPLSKIEGGEFMKLPPEQQRIRAQEDRARDLREAGDVKILNEDVTALDNETLQKRLRDVEQIKERTNDNPEYQRSGLARKRSAYEERLRREIARRGETGEQPQQPRLPGPQGAEIAPRPFPERPNQQSPLRRQPPARLPGPQGGDIQPRPFPERPNQKSPLQRPQRLPGPQGAEIQRGPLPAPRNPRNPLQLPEVATPEGQARSESAISSGRSAELPSTPQDIVSTGENQAREIYANHEDFGEVTLADNQKGVPRGKVRVSDANGEEHIIQKRSNNQRAIRAQKQQEVEQARIKQNAQRLAQAPAGLGGKEEAASIRMEPKGALPETPETAPIPEKVTEPTEKAQAEAKPTPEAGDTVRWMAAGREAIADVIRVDEKTGKVGVDYFGYKLIPIDQLTDVKKSARNLKRAEIAEKESAQREQYETETKAAAVEAEKNWRTATQRTPELDKQAQREYAKADREIKQARKLLNSPSMKPLATGYTETQQKEGAKLRAKIDAAQKVQTEGQRYARLPKAQGEATTEPTAKAAPKAQKEPTVKPEDIRISPYTERRPAQESTIRSLLKRKQERGRPVFTVGDEIYSLADRAKYSINAQGELLKIHDISPEGFDRLLERYFQPDHEAIDYNQAAKERFDTITAEKTEQRRRMEIADAKAREEQQQREQKYAEDKQRAREFYDDIDARIKTEMKGKQEMVDLSGDPNKEKLRKVTVYGDFGIHREGPGEWTISHMPTKARVANFQSQEQAKRAVYRLKTETTGWDFTDPKQMPKELSKTVPPILKEVINEFAPETLPERAPRAPEAPKKTKAGPEKVSPRTGLTPTQEQFVTDKLKGYEVPAGKEEKTLKIKVPGDGEFTVKTEQQANNLHRRLTGEDLPNASPGVLSESQVKRAPLNQPKTTAEPAKYNPQPHYNQRSSVDAALKIYGTPEKAIEKLTEQLRVQGAEMEPEQRKLTEKTVEKLQKKQELISSVTSAMRELKPNGGVVSIKELKERLGGGAADALAEAIDSGEIETTRGDNKINKPEELFRDIVGVQFKGEAAKEAAKTAEIQKKSLPERIAMARQEYDPPEIEKTTKPWGSQDWNTSKRDAYKTQFREKYGLTEKQLDEIELRNESGLTPEAKRAFGMKAQPSKEYAASERFMPGQPTATEPTAPKTEKPVVDLRTAMRQVEPRSETGSPVSLPDLRAQMKDVYLTKEAFDKAILEAADRGEIRLHRHVFPGALTEAEKAGMVKDIGPARYPDYPGQTEEHYYIGANLSEHLQGKQEEATPEPKKPMIPLGSPVTTEGEGLKAGDKVQWKSGKMTLKGHVEGFDRKGNVIVTDDAGERVTVKRSQIQQPSTGEGEVSASSPSWREVKRLERAPQTYAEARKLVGDVRSEYRERSQGKTGTIYINQQGAAVIVSAGRKAGVRGFPKAIAGVNVPLNGLDMISEKLRSSSGAYGEQGAALRRLADQIDQAREAAEQAGHSAVSFVDTTAGSHRIKKIIREEDYHTWQRTAGLFSEERGGAVAEHFANNRVYQHIKKQLLERGGYPNNEIILNIEAAAKLASGQAEDYGVHIDDANDYLHSYYNHLAEKFGPEILEENIRTAPSAQRSIEDVRAIKGVSRPIGAARMEPRGTAAGRPAGRQARSADQAAMASRVQGRGAEGSKAPNVQSGQAQRPPAQGQTQEKVKPRQGFSVGSVPESKGGTILGSGFGGLQGGRGKQSQASRPLPNIKFNLPALQQSAAKISGSKAGNAAKTAREYFDNVIARDLAPPKQRGVNQPLVREAQEALKTAAIKSDKGKMDQPQTEAIIRAADDLMTAARMGDHKAIIEARKALRNAQIGHQYQTTTLGKAGAIARETGAALKGLGQSSRSAVFGGDLSFPLRQAWALTANPQNVLTVARAGKDAMWQALKSKAGAERVQEAFRNHPSFDLAQERGLELSSFGKGEEVYQGIENVEKVPLIGKLYERTEAANTAFLDYMRLQKFHSEVQKLDKKGMAGNARVRAEKALAEAINTMTGKTDLGAGKFKAMTDALQGTVMTSPQLNVSRLQQLNPVKYAQLYKESPQAAKLMARETGAAASTIIGLGVLGTLAGVGKFITDRKDPDFGKFRAGKVTHDLSGGLLPQIKLALEIADYAGAEGKNLFAHSSKTEKAIPKEREEMLNRIGSYIRTRETPLAGLAHDVIIKGKDIEGNKMTVRDLATRTGSARAAWRAFGPAYVGDFYDGFSQGIGTGLQTLPTFFGGQETVITPQMEKRRREAKKKAQGRR